jgi:23S rRNA (uracil1939-C5)-methyltransferase
MGADGDGIGTTADGATVYAPLTLPGELVSVVPTHKRGDGIAAILDRVIEASSDRVTPPCPYFGACGGCVAQHWADAPYIAWKTELLTAALRRAGFADAMVSPAARTPPGARRRMDLALRRAPSGVLVGLHRARSDAVVDLSECRVLHPALVALMAPLRRLLHGLRALRRQGSAIANLLDSGPDLLLRLDGKPDTADRTRLTDFARAHGLPRIHCALNDGPPEPVCMLRPATLALSGVRVAPPPGGFLQPSTEAEAALVAAVLAALPAKLPPRARIAELYAGIGTFTFALAGRARVAAFESDAAALRALRDAANRTGLTGRIEAMQRDLVRQPLSATELSGFAAVVLDPPHSGAAAQMPAIAQAKPACVVYVGCNPATLARDAAVLKAAGYGVVSAVPVDQFLWSARLESVVVFAQPRRPGSNRDCSESTSFGAAGKTAGQRAVMPAPV